MKKPVWYRWPEGYYENFLPWFVILWRTAFIPLVIAGVVLFLMGVAICFGLKETRLQWRNLNG